MSPPPLRIATRESPLAMWQAHYVAGRLQHLGYETLLVPLVSGGDIDLTPIDGTRQMGVFTKRIQQALIDDEADIAVHSLKDLPTLADPRFVLAAVPPRESVADCWVSDRYPTIDVLPENGVVGTGSTRRIAQLRSVRPDLKVIPIRGNVQTRLQKLTDGDVDALILAHAGLLRLEMRERIKNILPLDVMLPAPGQGALGIEVRAGDSFAHIALQSLDHWPTRSSVIAERTILSRLHGGCLAPIAAHATWQDSVSGATTGFFRINAMVGSIDGQTQLRESAEIEVSLPITTDEAVRRTTGLAGLIADRLEKRGASKLVDAQRA